MLMNSVLNNIKTLVNSSVIKIESMAKQYETLESISNSDAYISAVQKTDRFDLYTTFDIEVIEATRITTSPDEMFQYANNPSTIPSQYREVVLNKQREFIINDYVEINNYYRMLNGLPDIEADESEFIRLTSDERRRAGIITDDYIHVLSDDDIYKIEECGLLSELIEANPDKKYLKYLGYSKIDVVTARLTNNFGILKVHSADIPDEFYNTFLQIYNQNREYFMTVIYIQSYGNSYKYYDNFIGLCIMLMTIQRTISNTFKFGIQREFYDWQFIQNMYKTYNVPFIDTLPIEYHISILKNLNKLLRYKSTDKVLFDIASLLGYERMDIFKYYLIKRHRLDENEEPIFYYKQKTDEYGEPVLDDAGNPVYIEDLERMYDVYFQRVNLKEQNIPLALQDENNRMSYDEVTMDDPYWWDDSEIKTLLYEETYNYVETKYISLNMMYKMTEMLFELSYAFRMMIDKKDDIDNLRLAIPKIYPDGDFKLFDIIIFMIALLCKHYGFVGNIPTKSSKISHIYAFDFNEESINAIKKIILDNPKIIDQKLLSYFENLQINDATGVNNLFDRIREYNNFILDKMRASTNIREYNLYKTIFKISMVSEVQEELFTISRYDEYGNIIESRPATTYLEYLKYTSPVLAQIVTDTEKVQIPNLVEHVISVIGNFMETMKYLFVINDDNNPVFNALIALLRFFKSYTIDLHTFGIIYVFDSKYYNMFKMIEDFESIKVNMKTEGSLNQLYTDDTHLSYKDISIPKDMSGKLRDKLTLIWED